MGMGYSNDYLFSINYLNYCLFLSPMLTSAEMRQLERYAISRGITPLEMMENAGRQVAEVILQRYDLDNSHVVIFAGQGNNGGDGFVAARYLAEHAPVVVLFFGHPEKLSEEAFENYERIKNDLNIIPIHSSEDLHTFHFQKTLRYIFIDAYVGTGLQSPLRDEALYPIAHFNQQQGIKISVDIPSGLNPDTGEGAHCESDLIVTFHDLKVGLEQWKEKTVVVDIGIQENAR